MNNYFKNINNFFYTMVRFLIVGYLFSKRQIFKYYLPKILFHLKLKKRYIIREIHGSKMYLDLQDSGISRDLLKNENRELLTIETVKREVNLGNIVIDIGANIGYYALLEAKLVGNRGKVYTIEPIPQNFELLKRNIKLNGYKNIKTFQLAVGNNNKTDFIYLSKKSNCHSMIKSEKSIGKILVKVISLDDFLKDKPYPNFIRMDVEGYETEIIKGMKAIFELRKPLKIVMEIHSKKGEKVKEMLKTLQLYGFEVKIAIIDPSSPDILIQGEPQFIKRIYNFLAKRLELLKFGYLDLTIDDLLNSEFLVQQILLERK